MKIDLIRFEDVDIDVHREILALRNSDRVRLVSYDRNVIELASHLQWVETLRSRRDVLYYAAFRDGEFVGTVNLTEIDRLNRSLEWGAAFHTDALFLPALLIFELLDRVFLKAGFDTVSLAVAAENEAAVRTNRRFGFREAGSRERDGRDYLVMIMTAEEWRECRARPAMRAAHLLRDRVTLVWHRPPDQDL